MSGDRLPLASQECVLGGVLFASASLGHWVAVTHQKED